MSGTFRRAINVILEINNASFSFCFFIFIVFVLLDRFSYGFFGLFKVRLFHLAIFILASGILKIIYQWKRIAAAPGQWAMKFAERSDAYKKEGRQRVVAYEKQSAYRIAEFFSNFKKQLQLKYATGQDAIDALSEETSHLRGKASNAGMYFYCKFARCFYLLRVVFAAFFCRLFFILEKCIRALLVSICCLVRKLLLMASIAGIRAICFFERTFFYLRQKFFDFSIKLFKCASKMFAFIQIHWVRGRAPLELSQVLINYFFVSVLLLFFLTSFLNEYLKISLFAGLASPRDFLTLVILFGIIWMIFVAVPGDDHNKKSTPSDSRYLRRSDFLLNMVCGIAGGIVVYYFIGPFVEGWVRVSATAGGVALFLCLSNLLELEEHEKYD